MTLGGQEHVDEAAGDVRPDRIALEGAGETTNYRPHTEDIEMIAPEERQQLQQRRIANNRGMKTRIELGEIDRAQALVLGLPEVGVLIVTEILPRLQHCRDHAWRCGKARI